MLQDSINIRQFSSSVFDGALNAFDDFILAIQPVD